MKVADFGIAKTQEAAHTRTGQVFGTIAYLSPQRLAGAPASVADDLYAVGVVGYEALAGHRPFPQENMGALARAILHDRPPPLALLRPDVDPALITAIERAMAPDPRQRFGSAEEMRGVLHGRGAPLMAGVPLAALAVLAAMIVVPFAIASDPAPSNAPAKPVTTSTPSPVPMSVSNPVPPPPPTEQPPGPPRHGPGKGHGKGHGGGRD